MQILSEYLKRFKIYITNSAWVFSSLVIRTLIVIFIVSKIANHLGISDFGWYNFGISIFTIFYSISTLGFGDSFLIKYFVDGKTPPEEIICTALIARIIGSLLLLIIILIWIVGFTKDYHNWVILIISTSILFQSSEVFGAYYQWKLKANVSVPVTVISLIIVSILLIFGITKNYGLFYFAIIYTLERVLIFFGLLWVINKEVPLRTFRFNVILFKLLFIQSWPLLLGALLTALYSRFDQVLIKYFLTTADLGVYGTSIILSQIWLVFPSLIIPVLFPKIAQLKLDDDKKNYNNVLLVLYGILNYTAIGVILFIFIFGDFIVNMLYGKEYADSVFILNILILNLIFLFQSHLTSSIMILENEEKYLFKLKLVSVLCNVLLNLILLSLLGVRFAAFSLLISSFISWVLMAMFNKKMFALLKLNCQSFLIPLHIKKILK